MYQIGDVFIRLDHVSLVGSVQKAPSRPGVYRIAILINGQQFHEVLFANEREAQDAHRDLLTAINRQGSAPL